MIQDSMHNHFIIYEYNMNNRCNQIYDLKRNVHNYTEIDKFIGVAYWIQSSAKALAFLTPTLFNTK